MTKIYNLYAAKTHLSELVERASNGETLLIAKGNKPMASLGPPPKKPKIQYGFLKGKIKLPRNFFKPDTQIQKLLDEEEIGV
jgi:antitoxin (DNA-binding transcriptional repressor) of toxin-antitoxin stability system